MVPFAGLSEVWIFCRSGAQLHKCALAQSRDSREGTERLIPLKDGDVLLLSHAARVALHSSRLLSCGGSLPSAASHTFQTAKNGSTDFCL